MLRRFALYGFLKNQQYFEPFLFLVFLEKGLDFFQIGLLIGFRELCVSLMEVPSGTVADLYGRRRAMILSFGAYILSFMVFATARTLPLLFLGMFLFAVGKAFRTGTHKAMIFWSKLGSALSVLVAAALVFWTGRYSTVFWLSIPPYLLGMLNFLGYDDVLDRRPAGVAGPVRTGKHLVRSLQVAWQNRGLRRLVVEAAAFEGAFRSGRDYLQPVLQQAALALPLLGALEEGRRSAVLIGVVYAALYLLSSVAARKSHRFATRFGGETTASGALWLGLLLVYLLMIPAFSLNWTLWLVLSFLTLGVVQNLWRPMIISRFHEEAPEGREATILSIESQTGSLATVVLAPLLGFLADQIGFAGVGMIGSLLAALVLMLFYGRRHGQAG